MKKLMLLLLVAITVNKASAQEDGTVNEERSSAWLKVSAPAPTPQRTRTTTAVKPKATVTKKKAEPQPAPVPKTTTDPFSSTNNQVKRFKKKTNG